VVSFYTGSERREDMLNLVMIGQRIADRRKALGMTQEDLAERLNVTRQAVSKYEIGKNVPAIDILVTLTNVLGMSIDEILMDADLAEDAYEERLMQYPRQAVIRDFLASEDLSSSFKNVFFRLHSEERQEIIRRLVSGALSADIRQVWPYLDTSERTYVLANILSGKTPFHPDDLRGMLSREEMVSVQGRTVISTFHTKR
jgi:transcriptional regulator with XRE-family HTH domain